MGFSKDLFQDIINCKQIYQNNLSQYLTALDADVNVLIRIKSQDSKNIEHHLDTLLSLTTMGLGVNLFVHLLDYYKTIDAEGELFYWNEYDKEDE